MISDVVKRFLSGLPRGGSLLLLLALAHVPHVMRYYLGLWRLPEYQFYPFAIGAFVWLYLTRSGAPGGRWSLPSLMLFGLDVLCLAASVVLNSPWLAAVGMTAWCWAWCLNHPDVGYRRSVSYLVLLPLMTLRLPLNSDQNVIHWLQRLTTTVSSETFHQLGILHVREGNVLRFPNKSFLVAEACSGVQSLFAILFLAALVICLRRRAVCHGIVLLASAVAFAAGMNIARIMGIAFAWEQFQVDLSVGIAHDIVGYVCLALAAALLMSGDAFLGFMLQKISYLNGHGRFDHLRNPFIEVWNRLLVINPESGDTVETRESIDESQRIRPDGTDHWTPRFWFHCMLEFVSRWVRSRLPEQLIAGAPFCIAAAAGLTFTAWLNTTSDESVVRQYRAALQQVQLNPQDSVREEFCLRALSSLRPHEADIQFLLGKFLIAHDRAAEGLSLISSLAPEQTGGYPQARMWLVNQALQPEPLLRLDYDAIERQLQILLRQQPENPDVHQLLSQIYTVRREWQLAERHLEKAIRFKPELNLQLARLKQTLNRGPDAVRICGQRAAEALMTKLEKDRLNPEIRVALAEAQLLSGAETTARETMVVGLQQSEDHRLRQALAQFDLNQVAKRLTDAHYNRDVCLGITINALTLDPSSVLGLMMVEKLMAMGAAIPPDSLRPVVAHWESAVADDPGNEVSRIMLTEALTAAGESSKAIDALSPLTGTRPELRLALGKLQMKTGRTDEATTLLTSLIAESRTQLEAGPDDVKAAATLAESLLVMGQNMECRQFLQTLADDPAQSRIPTNPDLAALYGRACISEYDRLTGYRMPDQANVYAVETEINATADETMLLELLKEAMTCSTTAVEGIDRLARLSFSTHQAADDAERMIRQLRLEGDYGAEILNRLGMYALMLREYQTARDYLEQANARSRSQSPMILNNLAIAMVRSDESSAQTALELANQTVEKLPGNAVALTTRGEIYLALGKWNEAIADLTDAAKDQPASAEIHRMLERAYAGIPVPAMAAEHARKASELESVP